MKMQTINKMDKEIEQIESNDKVETISKIIEVIETHEEKYKDIYDSLNAIKEIIDEYSKQLLALLQSEQKQDMKLSKTKKELSWLKKYVAINLNTRKEEPGYIA